MRLVNLYTELLHIEKNVKKETGRRFIFFALFVIFSLSASGQSVISPYSISTFTSSVPGQVTEMTIDQATGNIYCAVGSTSGSIYKITPSASISTVTTNWASTGYWHPYVRTGYAYNSGSVYVFAPLQPVNNYTNNALIAVDVTTGTPTVLQTTSITAGEDACAFVGNLLYMSDGNGTSNTIYTYDISTSTFSSLGSGTLPSAGREAFRYCPTTGTLYFGNGNGDLYTVNTSTGALTLISTSLATSNAKFTIDPAGKYAYYIANSGTDVNRVDLATGVSSSFATGLSSSSSSDLEFGPSSSGWGKSLYVGGIGGIIYEVSFGPFDGGTPQNLTVCKNSGATSINSLLTASGVGGGTFTWTVVSGPSNGSLGASFPYSTASGVSVQPSGTTYTPNSGFSGSDAFTIQVSDGSNTATTTINVSVNPFPITGTANVCVGGTTTLSDATSGGTWSSGSTGYATVGSATGIVTGVSAGTVSISYTAGGCVTSTVVTVNAVPNPITGVFGTCVGSSTNLVESIGGGAWTSSNTGVATVGSATGTVTGVSPGTSLITYAFATGCSVSQVVTINAVPGSTTNSVSPNPFCLGAATTFSTALAPCSINMLQFNGSNSQASLGAPVTTAIDNITMEAWVSWSGATANYQFIQMNGNSGSSGYGLVIPPGGSGNLQILISGITFLTSAANIPIGTWTHVAAVRNSGTWSVYLNGTQYSVSSATTTPIVPASGFRVGCSQTGTEAFNGAIDEAKFWSSARSTAEIQADMNACNADPQTNLLGYWKFDEASGTSAADNSGHGNTLTESTIAHVGSAGLNLSSYSWNFADGGSSTASSVAHTYTASGNYSSTFTIMNSGGCTASATTVVTVNPLPATITGTASVCIGFTTTLSSASTGGTWSSSNAGVASVVAGTGVVTGNSAGTANITYTLPTGCFTFTTVTVNTNPPAIGGGPFDVCVGLTTTLTDGTVGGSWTSGNTGQATIGSSSGIVTGVSAGTPVITYTLGTGCYATQAVTVNPLPVAIAGSLSVCIGQTTTLTDATSGGTWSSGAPGTASVVAGTGVVTGNAAGTAVITYTLPTGCINTATVTVNSNPTSITGTTNVCTGLTTSLASTPAGGTWTSSDITMATVGSSSGIVTGVAAGVPTLTYTLSTGCIVTTPVTVNQTPSAIVGSGVVCVGSTTTLSDAYSGGTWTVSNPALASVGASSGVVTGLSAGTLNIIYTLPAGGCNTVKAFTVNPLPASIGGTPNVCVGLTATLSDSDPGGTWASSNSTIGSIGSASGIVTGVTAGTINITYTLPTGCITTTPFTVNPTPAAITGPGTVCEGLTITLADATTGGTWSSSNPAQASVGSSSGIVTGVAASSPTIIYTLPAGCTATKQITVNPSPAAIGGANTVCIGLTTTLTDGTVGGNWTSSNPGQATVGSASGIVTGIASGTPTITYTLPAGCFAILPMTVNPTPAAISGTTTVCAGSTTSLTDVTGGGTWSSSNTALATVGSSSGIVTGVAAGTPVITYTLAAGCIATTPVTVNGAPDISNFTSPTTPNPCLGSNATITVNSTTLGSATFTVTYSLSGANSSTGNTATLTMGASTGTFVVPSSLLTNTGATTLTITAITNASTCSSYPGSSNTVAFTVNPLPTAYTVMGTGSYCSGGAGIHVFLSNSVGGVSYQLYIGGTTPVGIPIAGTFAALDMGAQTAAGTYTIIGTNTTTTCSATMTGSAVISIDPLPTAYSVTGGGSYCAGGAGVAIGLANSVSGTTYQLWLGGSPVGSSVAGTGGAISFGNQTAAGTYTVIATNTATTCTNTMTGSATIIVNALPAAITGTTNVCAGFTTTLADVTAGGTWSSVNTAVATVGSASGVVTGVSSGTSVISYTLSTGCTMTTTVTVNSLPAAIAGNVPVCTGATMALTDAIGGGTWTSSNTAEATVGSTSGIVTGVASGTPTITYTLSTGCYVTTIVTVNTTPVAISGVGAVCVGSTMALTDATSGGTWTSSNTSLATIGSASGIVTGTGAGNPVISYTLTGCTAVATITVNPVPAAITGTPNVCVGSSVTLNNATTGGTWSSSNTTLATVGSSTGVVNGILAGNPTISYTLSTGCYTTTAFTVNPTPAAITGLSNVCVGSTTTLLDGTSGGTWTSSNTAYATVGGSTGIVTGVSAGSINITYTLSAGSCRSVFPMTVNPLPSAILGSSQVCVASSTALSDATTGGSWSTSNASVATVSVLGVVTGVNAGTLTITYTLPTGCIATKSMTVNPLPAAITGTTTVCVGATTPLADLTSGGTWSSSNTSLASVGASSGIVTGVGAGNPTITYTLSTGCVATAPMTVNATPAAITGASTVCTGLTTTLSDLSGGGTWSSSDITKATVGSTTGIVTGVAAGTIAISYTFATGCYAALPMTVNVQPASITGANNVCNGFSTTLTDATSGGTWTSSNTAVATIGSSSGVVSSVSTGAITITYTMPGGCTSLLPFTVNPMPAVITGLNNVCVGATITLSDATTGGTWSSSNPATATVGSSTGIVTGVVAGNVNITYTLPAGCNVSKAITINPLPVAITGSPVVCVNATTTLTDGTSGGTWSSSNIALATIGSSTGVVTGVTAGNPTFTYTIPTGCYVTIAGTVNPLPTAYSVTGGGAYCAGGTGVSVGLSGSASGFSYQLYNGVSTVGSPSSGTGSALSYGLQTTAGTYTVVSTNNTTGCFVTMSGSATVVVNSLPTAFTVTGGGNYCAGGTGVNIGLSNSTAGVNYQLFIGTATSGSPVAGTGGAIGFGLRTTAGTYTVVATNSVTGCVNNMTGIATVVIDALPTIYTVTGGGAYCTGGSGLAVGLSNSDIGTTYSLLRGGVATGATLSGTGGSLSFGLQTVAGTYTITAINTAGCSSTMSGSAVVSISTLPATFTMSPATFNYCAGGTGTAITLSGSQVGVNYQLYFAGTAIGSAVAGTGSGISFGLQTGAGTYTVVATNTLTTCTNTMTGSTVITITPLPAVFTLSGGGGYCSGGSGVTISLSGSSVGVNYELYLGSTLLGSLPGTGGVMTTVPLTAPGTYTAVARSTTAPFCSVNMLGSVLITVNPLPTVYNVTGGGSYCSGGVGVHVGLSTSDIGINYQLYLDGSVYGTPVAGTGGALDFGSMTASGTYTVGATNATTLCTSNMSGSAVVNINPLPALFSITGGGSYCSGGAGLHIGLSGSASGVNYQLYNGVTPVGAALAGTTSALDFGVLFTSGSYTVVATTVATGCTNTMTGTATITVSPLPTINTVTGGGSYCAGGAGLHVGLDGSVTTSSYQLYLGTALSGPAIVGTGSALDFGIRTSAGTYTVMATDIVSGCVNTMAGSATIVVNPLPVVFNVTGGGAYCAGSAGVHVGLSNSTIGIDYQLSLDGTPLGLPMAGTGSALDFGYETTPGVYTVDALNSVSGCTNAMSGSAAVAVNTLPLVYTVTGGGNYCLGGSGVLVGLNNTEITISYQLYNGTSPVGAPVTGTGGAISFGPQTAAGTYTVVATNTSTSCSNNMTGSAVVVINPLPVAYIVTGGGSYCNGGAGVHVGLSGSEAGTSYQLFNGTTYTGTSMTGTGTAIDFGLQTMAGTYSVVATSTSLCTNNMTGSVTVSVNPLPLAYAVTGGGNYCSGGTGVNIGLSNSEVGVNYQLYMGTSSVGLSLAGTGTSLDFGVFSTAGSYTVVATNASTTCTATMTGGAVVTINPLPTVYTVTGGGGYCAGGAGLNVGLSSSDAGITYQLYRGTTMVGAPIGGSGFALDFGVQTAGYYTVVATDATTGCMQNMGGGVTVVVNPLPTVFAVTGGGSYCTGGSGFHIGVAGSSFGVNYQLYNGTTPVGMPVAGTGSPLDFGVISVAGTYTVRATNPSTSCWADMSGSAVITINPLPATYTVTGGGDYCTGGTGVTIGLSGSNIGINYRLYRGTTLLTTVAGTDSTLSMGTYTTAGAYTIVAVDPSSSCSSNMTGSAIVTIDPLPVVYNVTGGGSYCAGGVGLHVLLNGSSTGVNYQLYLDGSPIDMPVAGTGFILDMGVHPFAGNYTITATNATTGCTNAMSGSAVIAINPLPALFTLTGGGSYCAGGTGLHIVLNGSAIGINYQLYRGSTPVGTAMAGTGSPLDFGAITIAGTYTVVGRDPFTTCTNTMTGAIAIVVNPLPATYSVFGGGSYCAGGTGVTVSLTGSDAGVSYQLYRDGVASGSPVAGTGTGISFGLQTLPGLYTVVGENITTTCTQNMAGTALVSVDALPVAYTVSGGGSYCAGGAGLHISLSGSATGIAYQLRNGGSPVGSPIAGTGAILDFGLITAPGLYTITATNTATGCGNSMTGSATITVNALPTVFTVTGGGSYCAGTSGVAVGLSGSQTGVDYQIYNGSTALGSPASGTGSSISFGLQTLAGAYTVVATNPVTGCTSNMTGSPSVSITPTVIPSVTIGTGVGDTVCDGTAVTFSTLTVNAGTAPTYQWYVNSIPVASGSSYSFTPANGDVVSVSMTSSAACATPPTTSDVVTMTVLSIQTPTITITSHPGDTVCQGTAVNYTVLTTWGGTAPTYSWILNGSPVSTAATYAFTPVDNDVLFCVMNSSYGCVTSVSAISNNSHVRVETTTSPTISITLSTGTMTNSVAYNDTFTAVTTNEGFHPMYQWSINGVPVVGATSSVFIQSSLNNNDAVSCLVVNVNACGVYSASSTVVVTTSNVGVQPVVTLSGDIRLMPNPNKGAFTLQGNIGSTDQNVAIEVTDMLGQVVYRSNVLVHKGELNEHIQLHNIANGMYLLNLRADNGSKVFHMVIEQ